MKILCVDTSSKFLSLCLSEDAVILSRTHRPLDRRHSTRLVLFIERILKQGGVSLKNIDGFCISKGPGSFTGLRIGMTTVKGLAFVLQKPVTAIPTLDILAENVRPLINKSRQAFAEAAVCPIVDAKQNKIYTCIYQVKQTCQYINSNIKSPLTPLFQRGEKETGTESPLYPPLKKGGRGDLGGKNREIQRLSEYLLLPIEELLQRLRGKVFFLGDGVPLYRQRIAQAEKIQPVFMEERCWYPYACRAVPLAVEYFRQGRTEDVNSLTPLYLYPKECQIKSTQDSVLSGKYQISKIK